MPLAGNDWQNVSIIYSFAQNALNVYNQTIEKVGQNSVTVNKIRLIYLINQNISFCYKDITAYSTILTRYVFKCVKIVDIKFKYLTNIVFGACLLNTVEVWRKVR